MQFWLSARHMTSFQCKAQDISWKNGIFEHPEWGWHGSTFAGALKGYRLVQRPHQQWSQKNKKKKLKGEMIQAVNSMLPSFNGKKINTSLQHDHSFGKHYPFSLGPFLIYSFNLFLNYGIWEGTWKKMLAFFIFYVFDVFVSFSVRKANQKKKFKIRGLFMWWADYFLSIWS